MRTCRASRAFSLIEMMMALAIVSIIMLGCFSVVLLASKALPDRTTGPAATDAAAMAVDQLSYDLTYASAMSITSANDIEFLVQDRDGNGMPDKVRYTWSGVAGTSLNRFYAIGDPSTGTYTYGSAVPVMASIQEFALTYDKRATTYAVTNGESAEMPLASYDSSSNQADATVTGTNYVGEYFLPNLPSSATSWKVTRVQFKARANGFPDGVLSYQMYSASAGLLNLLSLDSGTISESRLSSLYTWQQVNFSNVNGISPGTGLCFLLTLNSGSPAGDIQYQSSGAPTLTFNRLTSQGSLTAWSAAPGQSMNFQVYGTVMSSGTSVTRYSLTGVRILLRSGLDTSTRVRATARTPNEPPVAGP